MKFIMEKKLMKNISIPTKRDSNISFQTFVKNTLDYMFDHNLLSDNELINLQDKEYCKKTFYLDFPLLETDKSKIKDKSGVNRYWSTYPFKNNEYYACSQWWKEKFDIYEPLFEKWILKILKNNI